MFISRSSLIIILSLVGLSGCQYLKNTTSKEHSAPVYSPNTESVTTYPIPEPLYKDMKEYGEMMGCKSALQQRGTPESGLLNAPIVPGTKTDYIQGWKHGFNKCLIGLGPVQLPNNRK